MNWGRIFTSGVKQAGNVLKGGKITPAKLVRASDAVKRAAVQAAKLKK